MLIRFGQLRDLEARAAAAATQEVASLERLNEMQAGFETVRLERAKAEKERDQHAERAKQAGTERDRLAAQMDDMKQKLETAKNASSPLKAANEKLQGELEDLRQQLTDAQDDLDDIKWVSCPPD
jgi:chromosome segregation ATPase